MTSSKPYYLPTAPFPNVILLGVRASGCTSFAGRGLKHSVRSRLLLTDLIYVYMNIFDREPRLYVTKHRNNVFTD